MINFAANDQENDSLVRDKFSNDNALAHSAKIVQQCLMFCHTTGVLSPASPQS
jgi:hypothetical protein